MYHLIFIIIIVNLLLLVLTWNGNYFNAAKPKPQATSGSCPSGQTRIGNKCVKVQNEKPPAASSGSKPPTTSSGGKPPTTSRLQNAADFFKKHPERVNNPPDAYKGLIQSGYLQKNGNNWTINTNPSGQPPARVWQPGGSAGKGGPSGSAGKGETSGSAGKGGPSGSAGGGKGGASGKLPAPKNPVFHNNSYGQGTSENRLPDTSVKNESGYVITDPGNLLWQNGGRSCTGVCAMLNEKDAAIVKKTLEQVAKNGGVPIGYMSLTIEPGREDIKGLKKGTDYTSNYMQGWSEYGPKFTQNYINLMKKRIDLYAQAGFKAMEFDNMDIINDPNVGKNMGVSPQQWQGFVKDMVQYANSKGIGVIQKNTPEGWGKDMNSIFAGGVVETKASSSKYEYDWNQIKNLLEQGKPVFLNNEKGNCQGVLNNVQNWTGYTGNNLIMGCKNN